MKKYYHVTLKKNLSSIFKKGLIPQIGERSKEANESEGVFLFPTILDMECALGQWLGIWFEEKEEEVGHEIPLISLEITLPDEFPIEEGDVEYEVISKVKIPPEYIKYLKDE